MPQITIRENESGIKLEKFLKKKLKSMPLSHVFKLIRTRKIKLNGRVAKRDAVVKTGDVLDINMSDARFLEDTKTAPKISAEEAGRLERPDVIYEDGFLIAVNKPAGLAVHGAPGAMSRDNLTLRVLNSLGELFGDSTFKPAPVHRLDKDTSGVVLFGKSRAVVQKLTASWRERNIEKIYNALVVGRPPKKAGKIGAPVIRRDGGKTREIKDAKGAAKTAVTLYKTIERYGEYTLLELHPLTGRTHQLRAHTRLIGCPIAGDNVYGEKETNKFLKKHYHLNRFFLHAASLSIDHPETGKRLTIEAPMPKELTALLNNLKRYKIG